MTRQIPQLLSFGGSFLHLDLQRLSRVKDELLEVSLIDMLLELFLEELTVNCVMTHSVMECTVVARFRAFWIRQERSRVPHPRLVLDGAEHAVNRDLEQSEVDINYIDFKAAS